jgi:hypothetical protein
MGRLASVPFTLVVLMVFLLTGAITGSFLSGPPESMLDVAGVSGPGLKSGIWWSLFTSLFFATNPVAYLTASLMILLLLGLAERKLGTLPTAALFFVGQFASVTVFLLLTQLARYAGDGWLGLMADSALIGPYAAVLTVSLAASGRLPVLWQRRLRTMLLSISLLLVLYVGHAETVIGLLGALLGLAAGGWIQAESGQPHRHRSTGRETRNLLALTVAVFAVGPILTAVARTPTGPLALLRDVVLNPLPTLGQLEFNCGATVEASCLEAGRQGFAGPFGLALAIVPVLLLLICADGMRRGRRMALRIALALQLAVTALAAVYLALFALIPHYPSRPHTAAMGSGFAHILPLVTVPLLLTILLWVNRRQFRVETSPSASPDGKLYAGLARGRRDGPRWRAARPACGIVPAIPSHSNPQPLSASVRGTQQLGIIHLCLLRAGLLDYRPGGRLVCPSGPAPRPRFRQQRQSSGTQAPPSRGRFAVLDGTVGT